MITPRTNPVVTFLLVIYCGAFAFDFRGESESGGNLWQYVMLALVLCSGLSLVFFGGPPSMVVGGRHLKRSLGAFSIFFFITTLTQLIHKNPEFFFLRVALPYVLMAVSYGVIWRLKIEHYPLEKMFYIVAIACSVSAFWRVVYAVVYMGVDLQTARYDILSPALPFLLGFGLARIMLAPKVDIIVWLSLVAGIIPVTLSLTRAYIISLAFVVACCWWCLRVRSRVLGHGTIHRAGEVASRIVICGVICAGALLAAIILRPGVLGEWLYRIEQREVMGTARDITLVTREAEIKGMLEAMDSPVKWAIGAGFGAGYTFSMDYFSEIAELLGTRVDFDAATRLAGHNFWAYQIFAVGIVGAIAVYSLVAIALYAGLRGIARLDRWSIIRGDYAVGLVATFSFLGQTFSSTPVGERFGALVFGLCMAAICTNTDAGVPSGRKRPIGGSGGLRNLPNSACAF